jgi:hypothetical protein
MIEIRGLSRPTHVHAVTAMTGGTGDRRDTV